MGPLRLVRTLLRSVRRAARRDGPQADRGVWRKAALRLVPQLRSRHLWRPHLRRGLRPLRGRAALARGAAARLLRRQHHCRLGRRSSRSTPTASTDETDRSTALPSPRRRRRPATFFDRPVRRRPCRDPQALEAGATTARATTGRTTAPLGGWCSRACSRPSSTRSPGAASASCSTTRQTRLRTARCRRWRGPSSAASPAQATSSPLRGAPRLCWSTSGQTTSRRATR
mmetsp:Transcript_33492/g.99682  ORF Transcript_33492/g.99682 Transcript_33492/m.99682 type:complete len:228 (-) Transcript_33492:431-1114(-)